MLKKGLYTLLFLFLIYTVSAQVNVRDSLVRVAMLSGTYIYQFSGGDLSCRFGNNSNVGGDFSYKTKKGWIIELQGGFLFSNNVKEDNILEAISTDQGYIIGNNGEFAEIHLYERGFLFSGNAGKVIPLLGPNKNSGIKISGGIGLLQHKIRIENPGKTAPQLSAEYLKGYDRLTNGLALTEFIGYLYLGNRRLINFYAGFEFTQAFTRNRRSYNFDNMEKDTAHRHDYLYGIKFGWIIPFYKRVPREYYYD